MGEAEAPWRLLLHRAEGRGAERSTREIKSERDKTLRAMRWRSYGLLGFV